MATSIPPHNPVEVLDAAIAAVDDRESDPLRYIKGPDFPTGGLLVSGKRELRAIYESGQGTLKLRGEWEVEEGARGARTIVVTSIPYAQEKATLVAKIADVIIERRLASLVDVRDESTEDVRIVLEIKREADPALVMTYLYKHTPLETTVPVNLTCLVPTARPEVCEPARLPLAAILRHFLDFRLETVRRRFLLRPRGAEAAPPPPRGLPRHLRRARRGDPHHPQVRRQGRRRREAHEALLPRRGAGRGDPRDEALQARAARDRRDSAPS